MQTQATPPADGYGSVDERVLAAVRAVVGKDRAITDAGLVELYSVDFSEVRKGRAGAVVRPATTAEVAAVVRIAHAARVPVCVRGGGMSYTQGYLPQHDGTLMLDMSGMNRIDEINVTDLYITVETGVTWQQLYHALDGSGYHLPFGGTFSGERATVGGGLGNSATAVKRGEIFDGLLGMEVVLPDGRVLQTGSRATGRPVQPLPNYGPDLTGLFCHDAGILGVKTRATFRLERRPRGLQFATFGFQDTHRLIDVMCTLGREGLVTENAAFSAYHNRMLASQPRPPAADIKAMIGAIRAMAPTRGQLWRYLLAMARPGGMKFLGAWQHALNVVVDGYDAAAARRQLREVKRLATALGATPLPPGLAIASRAKPFYPIEQLMVGAGAQTSTFPSNRCTSYSHAHELNDLAVTFFAENEQFMREHDLLHTIIYLCVNDAFGIEPIIYWRDAMNPLRASVLSSPRRDELLSIPDNPGGRAAAIDLRRRLVERVQQVPGAHYQIGKFYPYQRDLCDDVARAALRELKALLDPHGIMNPGGLGL
ncbi:MAG: FAD-binding oxidoreductase [Gammaproteobacteria bacterium]|nr:FAD-binding oxidoreductase [Gammaproteobacteria bacterium]